MPELNGLTLDHLPALPQRVFLKKLSARLWSRADVVALWLGGSFASGTADRYSDVDLRIAVLPSALSAWTGTLLDELFDGRSASTKSSLTAEDFSLHHLLLDNAESYDVWVQTPQREPHREPKLVLGCRENALRAVLAQPSMEERLEFKPAEPAPLADLIEQYWANHVKHEKVLHRGLHLLMRDAMYLFGGTLMRLQFVLATGQDCGDVYFPKMTIHTITPVVQTLEKHYGAHVRTTLGVPTRTVAEVVAALEELDHAVAQAGRQVAQRFGFPYPEQLESIVLKSWQEFKRRESL